MKILKNWAFIFGLCLSFFAVNSAFAQPVPATLQNFRFINVKDNSVATKANLKPNMPLIVMLFDPDCDHCQKQAGWFNAAPADIAKFQFMFVSFSDNAKAIAAFGPKYLPKLVQPNVFLQDKDLKFDNYFGESQVPTLLVYDAAGKMLKRFTKETPVAEIKALLK